MIILFTIVNSLYLFCFSLIILLSYLIKKKKKFVQKIECVHNQPVMELMRGVRSQLSELISGLGVQDLAPMSLGLSHSLSRYKLKFSADKVCFFKRMISCG